MNDKQRWYTLSSTANTFNGANLNIVWDKENTYWSKLASTSSYPYPKLNDSKYCNELGNLNKLDICQDLYWSADGTSLVAINDDYGIRQYLIPESENCDNESMLVPFTRTFSPRSIIASALSPTYSLFNENRSGNMLLISGRDVPLQSYQLDTDSTSCSKPSMTYNTLNDKIERYDIIFSMIFINSSQFITGSVNNKISLYDVRRKEPVVSFDRFKREQSSSKRKSIISCFIDRANIDCNNRYPNIVYFGTYGREMGVVDKRMASQRRLLNFQHGNGVYQILPSFNGHFLYILHRSSNTIDIVDVRKDNKVINQLRIPYKIGTQKMKGTLSETNGLMLGTDYGSVINWQSDMIEFGGLASDGSIVKDYQQSVSECLTSFTGSRINIVQQCPQGNEYFAISYSPDKFSDSDKTSAVKSGISLLRASID
ncbi:hypothetical protein Kpol_1041p12 [Vanderwaltozyma polyspora DSM 70294]|uniref:Protein SWT21 n=1 Tax=Vanderwaltozyma polyspora (strain ATCC 22028 / DSM 70294 / BCRC 21397 / CBS 2163 / NBRC 10782 / NRRL Y-8283 / UCD 57-17) TaxID=436907 RepID=SWT21_VANPO|nr:uncharacterized protein Kpol_1041p12 [Vanderwaltozyma polyspora DSM 70294]A7TL79.1 RecName: Full=Protein SWT21 [Vanderwaltozyma polyspora DSM 70294]EDO16954.1 hypothetical protein Kpol_1041p12 [Vanderwaltozyma polyspora DSM 70294]